MAQVVLYSDFVCPYCYLAERGGLRQLQERDGVDVEWRGFQLHPATPVGGAELSQLFGPRVTQMHAQLEAYAAQLGIPIKPQRRIANTRFALAMAEYARDHGKLEPFRAAVMDAYWLDGKDIEDRALLRSIAESVGLDGEAALAAGSDPAFLGRIDSTRADAGQRGITGIPTAFVGEERIVGCRPYEAYRDALRRAE